MTQILTLNREMPADLACCSAAMGRCGGNAVTAVTYVTPTGAGKKGATLHNALLSLI